MKTENTLTGYQYGADNSFIGIYEFPQNMDQASAHLPPHTTLTPPPADLPAGMEAAFNVEANAWEVRPEDLGWMDEDSRAKFLAPQAEVQE